MVTCLFGSSVFIGFVNVFTLSVVQMAMADKNHGVGEQNICSQYRNVSPVNRLLNQSNPGWIRTSRDFNGFSRLHDIRLVDWEAIRQQSPAAHFD